MPNYRMMLVKKWTSIKQSISSFRFIVKPFLILSGIYAVGISAILRANFNYIDDIGRVALGYKQWDNFSRYLSNFLSSFIHADSYLSDVSPLPQLLAVFLLALSGVLLVYIVSGKKTFSLWDYAALIPLGLSPYFLQCFSYKYDAPYMALSILASILPLLFSRRGYGIYSLISMLGILVVCTTYQAASGIFPMLVVLVSMKRWQNQKNGKDILKFIAASAGGYAVGLVLFKLFIMHPVSDYVSNSLPTLREFIPVTLTHLKQYFALVKNDFKIEWLVLILLLGLAFVYVTARDSKRKKSAAIPVSCLTLAVMMLFAFGIYPLLSQPLFEPRAMYGFGVLLAFLGVTVSGAKKIYPAKLACLALSWAFFVFAFTYGNALAVQSAYTDFRISTVIEDLNDLDILASEEEKTIQIFGSIGWSPVLNNMPTDYQMLNRMVPVTFQGGGRDMWDWGQFGFFHYYGMKNVSWDPSIDLSEYDLPVLQDTMYHTIRGNERYILVELK